MLQITRKMDFSDFALAPAGQANQSPVAAREKNPSWSRHRHLAVVDPAIAWKRNMSRGFTAQKGPAERESAGPAGQYEAVTRTGRLSALSDNIMTRIGCETL
jgi:hypothetical protein